MAKSDLPGWFPFALAASAVIAIGAGIRSGWKAAASAPKTPPVTQAGVLQDWATGDYRI